MTAAIRGLDHVNIRAPEDMIERLRAFYRDVIGLVEGHRPPFTSRGYWLYADDRDVLHLTIIADTGTTATTGVATTGWFDHVAFTGIDLVETLARLDAAGVAYEKDEVAETEQVQLFLTDPAGIGVEFNFIA